MENLLKYAKWHRNANIVIVSVTLGLLFLYILFLIFLSVIINLSTISSEYFPGIFAATIITWIIQFLIVIGVSLYLVFRIIFIVKAKPFINYLKQLIAEPESIDYFQFFKLYKTYRLFAVIAFIVPFIIGGFSYITLPMNLFTTIMSVGDATGVVAAALFVIVSVLISVGIFFAVNYPLYKLLVSKEIKELQQQMLNNM